MREGGEKTRKSASKRGGREVYGNGVAHDQERGVCGNGAGGLGEKKTRGGKWGRVTAVRLRNRRKGG